MMRQSTDRWLATDAEIQRAAWWRLDRFGYDQANEFVREMAELLARGVPVDSGHPEIARLMVSMRRRGDRRSEWSALLAVAVLAADAHHYPQIYYQAGQILFAAMQSAEAKQTATVAVSELSEHIATFQRQKPSHTARQCFSAFLDEAEEGGDDQSPFYDHDPARKRLFFYQHTEEDQIEFQAFEKRFNRIRNREKNLSEVQTQRP
jgi:hypothetical protein